MRSRGTAVVVVVAAVVRRRSASLSDQAFRLVRMVVVAQLERHDILANQR